jgi:penicillin G amidase
MVWVRRVLAGVAGLLVLVLIVGSVGGTWTVRRGFPTVAGELTLAALDGPVEVLRDERGVPTIVASTARDLVRAQGFVHAQDRFWEMDVRRHVTAGRVAELFGEGQVDTDRFVRTLGWRRIAEQELELLASETIDLLEAYAEGVNAWIGDRRGGQLSLEHALLRLTGAGGYEPEPWSPADSVAWLKAMAWDLRSNLEQELERGRLHGVDLGPGRDWQALFPAYPYDRHETILPRGTADDGSFDPDEELAATRSRAELAAPVDDRPVQVSVGEAYARTRDALLAAPQLLGDGEGDGLGSNSWVISPERSATGSALLANDPHLGPSQPSLWYQVGLRCAEVTEACPFHAVGYSFSGVPGIVIGHNDRIAWGFTNLGPDVADLYVERLDGDRYLTEDGWVELEVHTELLRVAGGDDVEVTVRTTRHGPLLSDVSDTAAEIAGGPLGDAGADTGADTGADADAGTDGGAEGGIEHAVALRWTALDPSPTADAILGFVTAQDFDGFREAASSFAVPSQNLVYADVDGHIAYQAPGRVPVRSQGDGTVPVPGWTGEYTWERMLDFEELPWALDPPEGVLITANQAVLPEGAAPFLTADPNAGYRATRIHELLGDRDGLTLDDLLAVQLDEHNGNARTLVPFLLDLDVDEDARRVQEVLATWDLQDDVDSAGGAAFNATWRHLLARTFHDELPEWAHPQGGARWWEVVKALLDEPGAPWWDDLHTDAVETRDEMLAAALADAQGELEDRFGDDPADWRWGAMHTLTLRHGTFGVSGIGPIERLFNRGPLELGGGADILNANGWNAAEGYEVVWVPSMRLLVDLGELDAGRWIHLTGQSGRPFHRHYTDQAERWRDGETLPIAFSASAVEEAAVDRLRLVPDEPQR